MKIGMRTTKTAIAVFLTILISQIIHLKSPFFAGIAAIITMQSSVIGSFKAGKNRMLGTMLGAIIGLICSLIAPRNPFIIGLGIVVVIHLCNILGWKKSATIASVVFLSITLNQQPGNRLNYSIYRTLDTFVGIIIAAFVNYLILPPDFENKVESSCNNMLTKIIALIEKLIWKNENISDEELNNIKNSLNLLETRYDTFKKEIELNIYKSKNCKHLKNTYNSFNKIYENLITISNINFKPIINRHNSQILEKLYNKKVPCPDRNAMMEMDIIFNHHLKIILDEIDFLIDTLNFKNNCMGE